MSSVQFKKRTIHFDILGKVYNHYQHVVMTCSFCNSTKPRPDRSRVNGLSAEEFRGLIFLDHGCTKIGDQTSQILSVLNCATSHLTAYPCKMTSPSEVISKLHEWMDTFQKNRKAICADMDFRHPHDMQACYRMYNVKKFPTGPQTPWPNLGKMEVRMLQKFLSALLDTASKNLNKTTPSQMTPAQLMCKAATMRNTQVTWSCKAPME